MNQLIVGMQTMMPLSHPKTRYVGQNAKVGNAVPVIASIIHVCSQFLFLLRVLQEMDVDIEDGSEVPKAVKRKPPKPEESKSKKEHVNVVFIGHVGKLFPHVCA